MTTVALTLLTILSGATLGLAVAIYLLLLDVKRSRTVPLPDSQLTFTCGRESAAAARRGVTFRYPGFKNYQFFVSCEKLTDFIDEFNRINREWCKNNNPDTKSVQIDGANVAAAESLSTGKKGIFINRLMLDCGREIDDALVVFADALKKCCLG